MSEAIQTLKSKLSVPVFAAPMFLVSNPDMVIEACKAGIVGTFPTMNARPLEVLEEWMVRITTELEAAEQKAPGTVAPWAANIIVHRSNERFKDDLDLICKYKPGIVITALGGPEKVHEAVHEYGGLVFSDVNSVTFAKKAVDRGADGLILVAAGAGGHTGPMTGFSFVPAVREFFDGPLVLGGGIVDGRGIRAAEVLGADFAYMGTRFIATEESSASDAYRQMLVEATVDDIICSPFFTGVPANYLLPSIAAAGVDVEELKKPNPQINFDNEDQRAKAWKDIWSAGQGVGATKSVQTIAEIVSDLKAEYDSAG